MQVGIEVKLPFYSWILDCENHSAIPSSIYLDGRSYYYSVHSKNKSDNEMVVSLIRDFDIENMDLNEGEKNKIVTELIQLINFIIYHARTFDVNVNLVLISPRNSKSVVFKIISDDNISYESIKLNLREPTHFVKLFEEINDPGASDIFTDVMSGQPAALHFNLLVDSFHSYYEGRYSESVINSITAIESIMYPIIKNWLSKSLFSKSESHAESIIREIPSKLKYEMLFGMVKKELFEIVPNSNNLLEQLKEITQIRNKIIHDGKRATQNDAFKALETSSHFVEIITFDCTSDVW